MSRMAKEIKKANATQNTVVNFEGGKSFIISPLQRLKMIAASSIFGEASFYRSNVMDGKFTVLTSYYERDYIGGDRLFKNEYFNKTTTEVFTEAIDSALSYDFMGTLELAVELRTKYNMRLNPQVIMVRAAIHPDRVKFNEEHPNVFRDIQSKVMSRADEPSVQAAYYLWLNGSNKDAKKNLPTILKRSWAEKLSHLTPYQVMKYKNAEIGMINTVRMCHASSPVINELMRTGNVQVEEDNETWERLKSAGKSWMEIISTTKLGHMALLRNLRNIVTEIEDRDIIKALLDQLKDGVKRGKQFPFRYKAAWDIFNADESLNHRMMVMDALEECIDLSIENVPKLPGRTVILTDNSGSAWNGFKSEYGQTTIAEIDNLSSVIAAVCSDDGFVVKFGTRCRRFDISKRNGILTQAQAISMDKYNDVGGSTEPGVDEFFQWALEEKQFFDNIIIYSDLQVGHLYLGRSVWGNSCKMEMSVYDALKKYRREVNPKVNFFSVQTAGYDNAVIPEMAYRTALLSGWTGREIEYMVDYVRQWDEIENQSNQKTTVDDKKVETLVGDINRLTPEERKALIEALNK